MKSAGRGEENLLGVLTDSLGVRENEVAKCPWESTDWPMPPVSEGNTVRQTEKARSFRLGQRAGSEGSPVIAKNP